MVLKSHSKMLAITPFYRLDMISSLSTIISRWDICTKATDDTAIYHACIAMCGKMQQTSIAVSETLSVNCH